MMTVEQFTGLQDRAPEIHADFELYPRLSGDAPRRMRVFVTDRQNEICSGFMTTTADEILEILAAVGRGATTITLEVRHDFEWAILQDLRERLELRPVSRIRAVRIANA